MKTLKKAAKYFGIFSLAIILIFAGFLGYMTLKDFRPARMEKVDLIATKDGAGKLSDTLSFYTWNIGYAGLGAEQDFFFDGGKMVRPSKDLQKKYLDGIISTLESIDTTDFILLQEVDRNSKRSYFKDQVSPIVQACDGYAAGFSYNYRSRFVPQPVSNPYGRCFSGILTLARIAPVSANRFSLAPDASWPTGLFMLKRCFMEFRYLLKNGKELVVINQHLSAYDDGTVKQRQMDTLRVKLLNEYKKGNYVVVGGDWNQYPPGYKPTLRKKDNIIEKSVDHNYPEEGWKWAFDESIPTNRKLYEPFVKGQTDEVLIDYFLVSPNIDVLSVKGVDLGFKDSDHQPVYVKLTIKQN